MWRLLCLFLSKLVVFIRNKNKIACSLVRKSSRGIVSTHGVVGKEGKRMRSGVPHATEFAIALGNVDRNTTQNTNHFVFPLYQKDYEQRVMLDPMLLSVMNTRKPNTR